VLVDHVWVYLDQNYQLPQEPDDGEEDDDD